MVHNLAAELQGFMAEQGFDSIADFKGKSLPCARLPNSTLARREINS